MGNEKKKKTDVKIKRSFLMTQENLIGKAIKIRTTSWTTMKWTMSAKFQFHFSSGWAWKKKSHTFESTFELDCGAVRAEHDSRAVGIEGHVLRRGQIDFDRSGIVSSPGYSAAPIRQRPVIRFGLLLLSCIRFLLLLGFFDLLITSNVIKKVISLGSKRKKKQKKNIQRENK